MKLKDRILELLHRTNVPKLIQKVSQNTLTVLNYHRIDDPDNGKIETFKPNISATPAMFELQLDYLCENYNIVSGADVAEWIWHGQKLPPNAALVTFDDGYYDNLSNAAPELVKRQIPAIIFLTSNFIGKSIPFYWDLLAYCFRYTKRNRMELAPGIEYAWENESSRNHVMRNVISYLKLMPDKDKNQLVGRIPDKLDVSIPKDAFEGMMLSWSDVKELCNEGIEVGAHTASHPILTRIPIDDVEIELAQSKTKIEEETGRTVISFAYPNGQLADFNNSIITWVKKVGFLAAYTLLSGPTTYATVKRNPYEIRRIFLSHRDNFPKYVGKLIGLSRLTNN